MRANGQLRRRPRASPWLAGGLVIAGLVLFATLIDSVELALLLWALTVIGFVAIRYRANTSDSSNPASDAREQAEAREVAAIPRQRSRYPTVMTGLEAAKLLRISPNELIAAIRDGQLPGNRIGDHWRIRTESLMTWLDGPPVERG